MMDLQKEIADTQKKCKKRLICCAMILLACGFVLSAQIFEWFGTIEMEDQTIVESLMGFRYGLVFGLCLVSVFFAAINLWAVQNKEFARKIYVWENDDRNKLINDKAGIRFYLTSVVILLFGFIVASYFSYVVCLTLLGVAFLQILIALASKVYWKLKI